MTRPTPCYMTARIVFALIGVVFGVSVFLCFGFGFSNWHTAVWGAMSGIPAAMTLALHIWYRKDNVTQFKLWAHRLKPVMILGCFIQLAGVCGVTGYLTVAILEHQALVPQGRGFYLTSIWCFMTWKWGFLLFLYALEYRREFRRRYRMDPDVKYEQFS